MINMKGAHLLGSPNRSRIRPFEVRESLFPHGFKVPTQFGNWQ